MSTFYYEIWTATGELVAACKYPEAADMFAQFFYPGSTVKPVPIFVKDVTNVG
jgi:hypothetical protein